MLIWYILSGDKAAISDRVYSQQFEENNKTYTYPSKNKFTAKTYFELNLFWNLSIHLASLQFPG